MSVQFSQQIGKAFDLYYYFTVNHVVRKYFLSDIVNNENAGTDYICMNCSKIFSFSVTYTWLFPH